jgi:hypothetical protein
MEPKRELTLEERLLDWIRYFNRRYFNPWSLCFAGRPNSFWSVLLHSGRRSGKEYITPIVAVRENGSFVIPLPYGLQVDWFKNVMAAGSCELIYHGKMYHASKPEMIALEDGIGVFARWVQSRLRRMNTEYLLRLNGIGDAPDGESRYRSFTETYPRERGLWVLAAIGCLAIGLGRQVLKRSKRPLRSR